MSPVGTCSLTRCSKAAIKRVSRLRNRLYMVDFPTPASFATWVRLKPAHPDCPYMVRAARRIFSSASVSRGRPICGFGDTRSSSKRLVTQTVAQEMRNLAEKDFISKPFVKTKNPRCKSEVAVSLDGLSRRHAVAKASPMEGE